MNNQLKTWFLAFVFCALFTVSCQQKPSENEKNSFKASIDFIPYQDCSIQIFYKIKVDDRYTDEHSLKQNVKASSALQNLVFEFPHGIKPKNIRINLGEKENDSVLVQNIRFKYKDHVLNGDKGAYKSWFTSDEIPADSSITDYSKNIHYSDRPLNGNRELNSRLVKLFPPDINEFN